MYSPRRACQAGELVCMHPGKLPWSDNVRLHEPGQAQSALDLLLVSLGGWRDDHFPDSPGAIVSLVSAVLHMTGQAHVRLMRGYACAACKASCVAGNVRLSGGAGASV